MKRAYLYPLSGRNTYSQTNPYLEDFMNSVAGTFDVINRSKPSRSGLFDIIPYLGRAEFVIFHWPENIVERSYGFFQTLFFFFLLPYLKIRKVKIVYVVHNKISHSNNSYLIKKQIARMLARFGDLFITHAQDGRDFINTLGKKEKTIFYFPHPLVDERPFPVVARDIDILIWGNIAPYKGIHIFLKKIKKSGLLSDLRIVIAGKVSGAGYLAELNDLKDANVEIINDYLDDEQLRLIISRSRLVLFPYFPESILSSGAFARSLMYPVEIVGPECGSFKDFSYLDHVNTFSDTDDMVRVIETRIAEQAGNNYDDLDGIIDEYNWGSFGRELATAVRQLC